MDETLVAFGSALKALGGGKIGGLLIRYSDADTPDLEGEFFTKSTDFGLELPARVGVYYNHGQDEKLGKKRLGRAELTETEDGIWFTAQLDLSDRYQAKVYELAELERLGASSGAAPHLVEKKQAGKATEILAWPVAEASVTVTPAEWRNTVAALKNVSLETFEEAEAEVKAATEAADTLSPLLRGSGKAGDQLTLSQHSEAVASAVEGYAERLESRHAARVKSGRRFSAATITELEEMRELFSSAGSRLDSLLKAAKPEETADSPQVDGEEMEAGEIKTPSPANFQLEALRLQALFQQERGAGVFS